MLHVSIEASVRWAPSPPSYVVEWTCDLVSVSIWAPQAHAKICDFSNSPDGGRVYKQTNCKYLGLDQYLCKWTQQK
jgi:hypothetical protein